MAERRSRRWVVPVLALALGAGVVSAPGSASASDGAVDGTDAKVKVCFSNLRGDSGQAATSQNFEAAFDAYDSELAGDLRVGNRPCRVRELRVVGTYFSHTGPAESLTVTFYRDAAGLPGEIVSTQTVEGDDVAFGTFELRLSRVGLEARTTYWVSVVANMGYLTGGLWGWELTGDLYRSEPAWRNPADGFATGCTDWGVLADCYGQAEYVGLDPMFEVRGKRRG